MGPERSDDGLQLSLIEFGTARRGPWFGFRAGCAKDRLSSSVYTFFGMELGEKRPSTPRSRSRSPRWEAPPAKPSVIVPRGARPADPSGHSAGFKALGITVIWNNVHIFWTNPQSIRIGRRPS